MKLDDAAARLEALGNPTRLKIYRTLVRAGAEGMPVGRLQAKLDAAASTLSKDLEGKLEEDNKVGAAKKVGKLIAAACKEKGITKIVFDRNGYLYHGRVSALAQAAREAGLEF